MPGQILRYATVAILVAGLAGCGGEPDLIALDSGGEGPDEFSILPNRPLELPGNFDALPPPTPGGPNRTDQTPQADAIAALGGNPAAANRGPEGTALLAHAGRFGTAPGIRATLAAEDAEFRGRNVGRPLERLFNATRYFRLYAPQSLDQYDALERMRARGVRTPAAPPETPVD
ncbi:DUF3035 domain-containing protein [Palleronia sp. LCG004]|uniref:DUF3035 domain-containing protein n=1 Tax=Palleronia sp. LCG004 TaxID=3079304 RepID=UPI002943E2F9|nr:DUF3035 domain-containing protein [Palleronia sp. LCG004]WOI55438.1 DUF3035 domain-containing protein [Palleronia sp. LCG004]